MKRSKSSSSTRMTEAQERHLKSIKDAFCLTVDPKYRAGQKEHGGNLYTASSLELLDNALLEVVDLFVYLTTLRQQFTAQPAATQENKRGNSTGRN